MPCRGRDRAAAQGVYMNQSPKAPHVSYRIVADPNPWADPPTLPRLSHIGTLLLSLFVLACAVYPAANASDAYAAAMLLACTGVYLAVVRSLLPSLAALALFLLGCAAGGLGGGVLLLCLVCTVAIGAYLICTVRSWWLVCVPVLAYACALIVGADAVQAVVCLIAFPAAGILAYAIMQNSGRVGTICATSAILGLCAVFALALLYYRSHGTLSWSELMTLLTDLRERLLVTLLESDQLATLQESLNELSPDRAIDASELVRTSVELTFTLLPAFAVTLCNFLGYTAQLSCTRAFVGTSMKQLMTQVSQLFIMSVPSAIVFLICAVAALFSDITSLSGAVIVNLCLILLPGTCLVGVFKLIGDVRRRRSPVMILLIIAALIFAPQFLIFGIALSGATTTLLRPLITRMMLSGYHQGKDDPSDKDE